MTWEIEFFAEDSGRQPAREWLRKLDPDKQAAAIAAIEVLLGRSGPDICKTEHGKALGNGLYELRIRHEEAVIRGKTGDRSRGKSSGRDVLLRVFFHPYGQRIVLLIGGYDKGANPSRRRQDLEIERARKSLRSFKLRRDRQQTGRKRRTDET